MKPFALFILSFLAVCTLSAQPRTGISHPNPGHHTLATPTIIVVAQHAENFYVYLNGDLVNETPSSRVVIDRLDNRPQQLIVVLNMPARKADMVEVYPSPEGTEVSVEYNQRLHQLSLLVPQQYATQNRPYRPAGQPHNRFHNPNTAQPTFPTHPTPLTPSTPSTPFINEPSTVSDTWVDEMVEILNSQSFDSEKLIIAKSLLNNGLPFKATQIERIARTFDFTTSQVDFLKEAYTHCYDPENYERALSVLTFISDREKVRSHIESLQ